MARDPALTDPPGHLRALVEEHLAPNARVAVIGAEHDIPTRQSFLVARATA